MQRQQSSVVDGDPLDQLAGVTGLGWTVSLLGYLGTVVGYGNAVVSRLVVDPQSLLYVGSALFLATFGLDRIRNRVSEEDG